MKALMTILALLTLLAGGVPLAYAGTSDVVVLFQGATEVNREAYNFLRRNLSQSNVQVNLTATQDWKSIKPGTYKAVVVMSSGLAGGVDPVLQSFVQNYSAKKEIFLVNLLKGSPSTAIVSTPAAKSPVGVDTVAAASTWSEGAEKITYIRMHQEWIKVLVDFLKTR